MRNFHRPKSFVLRTLAGLLLLGVSGCFAVEKVDGNTLTYTQSPIIIGGIALAGVVMACLSIGAAWETLPFLLQTKQARKKTRRGGPTAWNGFTQLLFSGAMLAGALIILLMGVPSMAMSYVTLDDEKIVLAKRSLFFTSQTTWHRYDSISKIEVEEIQVRGRRGAPRTKKILHLNSALGSERIEMNPTHEAALPKLQERVAAAHAGQPAAAGPIAAAQPAAIPQPQPEAAPAAASGAASSEALAALEKQRAEATANKAQPKPQNSTAQMPASSKAEMQRPAEKTATGPSEEQLQRMSPEMRARVRQLQQMRAAMEKQTASSGSKDSAEKTEIPQLGRYKPGAKVMTNSNLGTGVAEILKVYDNRYLQVRFQAPPQKEAEVPMQFTTLIQPKAPIKPTPPGPKLKSLVTYEKGTPLFARWGDEWYPATLVAKTGTNKYLITWNGEETQTALAGAECCLAPEESVAAAETGDMPDEDAAADAKRSGDSPAAANGRFKQGDKVEAQFGSTWYPAVIVEALPDDQYEVRFTQDKFQKVLEKDSVRRAGGDQKK